MNTFVIVITTAQLTFDLCAPENVGRLVTPAKKLEDTIRLAELVIEVLQQNEEHHAEVSAHLCCFVVDWTGTLLNEQWLCV